MSYAPQVNEMAEWMVAYRDMGTFFSLSKFETSIALDISEVALLLFGLLLVVGLIGEYAKSERWKKHIRAFELFVILGVAENY